MYIENENDIACDGFYMLSEVISAKTVLEHFKLFNEREINAAKDILINKIGIY